MQFKHWIDQIWPQKSYNIYNINNLYMCMCVCFESAVSGNVFINNMCISYYSTTNNLLWNLYMLLYSTCCPLYQNFSPVIFRIISSTTEILKLKTFRKLLATTLCRKVVTIQSSNVSVKQAYTSNDNVALTNMVLPVIYD